MIKTYPVLPLRDIVIFPHMVVPLYVGRQKSIHALESVLENEREIFLVTQKVASQDDPSPKDLYEYGTVATILQLLKLPDGTMKVLVEGVRRAKVMHYIESENFLSVELSDQPDILGDDYEMKALLKSVKENFTIYSKLNRKVLPEVGVTVDQIEEPAKLSDIIAGHITLKIQEKQDLLQTFNVAERLNALLELMEVEIGVLQIEKKIKGRVRRQMEKSQREYYLNEQMKAIQKELGEIVGGKTEYDELEEKIKATKLSDEAREKCEAELRKLKQMSTISAEATVIRNYLDWILALPWDKKSKTKKNLPEAQKILDADHFGLEKVKERIVEFLAVHQRVDKIKGPILCLVGPPGVGKTSLGKSIAKALGREFIRISLGGVRDEAEIRGHRRTYIGSMPGKIIQSLKKVKTQNPLILLDEIDKMGSDNRGDPASALLEVLDPEQNLNFNDHYLEVDYDLSDVLFLTTANSLNMPRPLVDRMEIIRLSGYTEQEKLEIAKRYMVAKQGEAHGLKKSEYKIDDDALMGIIRYYTREAGVRNLEREISKIMRKIAKRLVLQEAKKVTVKLSNLKDFLGVRKYKYGEIEQDHHIGATTGLAWTEVGGEILSIEAVVLAGKGKMVTTGKLGDVMKESIEAAASFIRSKSRAYGIKEDVFEKKDVHVHVPEGATPKDGPSAGVGMVTSIVSALTNNPVRKDVAMTGEVTLRGRVLAIGGLKEKLLAAHRGGIKTVFIPQENEKDLEEIPANILEQLEVIPVDHVDQILPKALVNPIVPDWSDPTPEEPPVIPLDRSNPPEKTLQ
jgi:ATP-dependent Lon protease